jgi:hypothetical protein
MEEPMIDIPSITAAISGLKTAADIAKAMKGLHDLADVQVKVADIQSALLDAQSSALAAQGEQFTLMQKMRDLEEEVARVKAWDETKQRYQLIAPWEGCHVYALKEASKGTEPPHWICPHCYEDDRKSILHNTEKTTNRRHWIIKCSRCSFDSDRDESVKPTYV